MSEAMNWIAAAAVLAATALAAQAVDQVVRKPTGYAAVVAEQDTAISELRMQFAILETTVEMWVDAVEMDVKTLRQRAAFEAEKARVQKLQSSDRASLFQSAPTQGEREAPLREITSMDPQERALVERVLIDAQTDLHRATRRVHQLKELLIENGIDPVTGARDE
jgi:hypothetical protein